MSASVQKILEMENQNQPTPELNEEQSAIAADSAANSEGSENEINELELPCWSIVSFEGVAMSGLTYDEARKWIEKLNEQNISGLCIVTDEAAARIKK